MTEVEHFKSVASREDMATFEFMGMYEAIRRMYSSAGYTLINEFVNPKDSRWWAHFERGRIQADRLGIKYDDFLFSVFEMYKGWKRPLPYPNQVWGDWAEDAATQWLARDKARFILGNTDTSVSSAAFKDYRRMVRRERERCKRGGVAFRASEYIRNMCAAGVVPEEFVKTIEDGGA